MKRKNRALALLLAVLMLLSTMAFTLTSCGGGKDPGEGGENGGGGNDDPGQVTTADYTVTLKTGGGMAMSGIKVYMYYTENGELTDEIAGAAVTDEKGKATFKDLDTSKTYAAEVTSGGKTGVPKGYNLKSSYPMSGKDMTISLKSSLIKSDFNGAELNAGSIMYDFTLTTLNGDEFNLADAFASGKELVMINFWYINCPNCRDEFPYMQAVYERYSDDVAIIAVNPLDSAADSKSYIDGFGINYNGGKDLTFDFAYDSLGLYKLFYSASSGEYGISGYPTSILIDRYGCITLIEEGGLPYEEAFELMFTKHLGDNYVQNVYQQIEDMEERKAPTVQQPSSDEIGAAFDKGTFDVTYTPEADDVWSWAFDITEKDGVTCIAPTNKNVYSSYAIINAEVELRKDEALAFDYFASTELGGDYLYVIVDGQDIYAISGQSTAWETCYAYVAPEDGTYTVSFVYLKDISIHYGDDTVWLKDFRKCTTADIDKPTYIYRDVASDLDEYGEYQTYAEVVYNPADGYYHVRTVDGPILLADLMGYTLFAGNDTAYSMSLDKDYASRFVAFCNYASNARINGFCSVTEELKQMLIQLAAAEGNPSNENEWLLFCSYYDAYGTNGAQLQDPIKGLAPFSAFDTVLSNNGDTDFPNTITYDRVIMPRGLKYKFTPTESGVYQIISKNTIPDQDYCQAWVFNNNDEIILEYFDLDRNNQPGKTGANTTYGDTNNIYIVMYMEEGVDYYIDIAFGDVYTVGDINFRIERLGDAGYYRFSKAAYGPLTYIETSQGGVNKYIAVGIDVVLGDDGFYHEARYDGNDNLVGSFLYADFTKIVGDVFPKHTLMEVLERGGFNLGASDTEGDAVAGEGDKTEWVREYLETYMITEGYNAILDETIEAGDERIGCTLVTKELADVLQKLHIKYTSFNPDNAWRRFCYYHEFFGPKN